MLLGPSGSIGSHTLTNCTRTFTIYSIMTLLCIILMNLMTGQTTLIFGSRSNTLFLTFGLCCSLSWFPWSEVFFTWRETENSYREVFFTWSKVFSTWGKTQT